ncbi:MAG: CDP-alcohol phosphatidyltransferase family protein [Actinobacteria bacterium]|nr:MAG: CDP-alcohol phosphatidyltransferase family protein [Actinomycetota bacterium]
MNSTASEPSPSSSRVLTVPNAISAARIASIPVFVALILDHDTTTAGLILFAIVVATDWIDGMIARRTGQVSDLGKVLDPVADRLAIAAGLIGLVLRGIFPLWAAAAILVRDLTVLVGGAVALARRGLRLEVRWIGKLATFSLMAAIPMVSWGSLGLPLAATATVGGWAAYAVGIVEYYVAAFAYLGDIRRASYRGAGSEDGDPAR